MRQKMFYFLRIAMLFSIFQGSRATDFYFAAVVEYYPVFGTDEIKMLEENLKNYEYFISEAGAKNSDIIVFPENGLTKNILFSVPDPFYRPNPCENANNMSNNAVKTLSCLARHHNIYVAVNLPESRTIYDLEGKEKRVRYNTNVVFDRKGIVVARYAKQNLFDEVGTEKPDRPEMSFFEADFGVRFGTFTCFDILFQEPALLLVKQYGVTDFLFTTRWFSELPFLTALQVQRGWAEANNVNLLASGYNDPRAGSTGSGIFNGIYGSVVHYMGDHRGSRILMGMVPVMKRNCSCNEAPKKIFTRVIKEYEREKEKSSGDYDNFALLSDHVELFESEVIKAGSDFSSTICSHGNFCCKFNVRLDRLGKNPKNYNYRAVAFNGVRKFGLNTTGGVQACGVILCTGPKIINCTKRGVNLKGIHEFSKLKIEGNFRLRNGFQIPTTLVDAEGKKLNTLPTRKYEFKTEEMTEDNLKKITMTLEWPTDDLLTFAVWGRDFTGDGRKSSLPVSKASCLPDLSLAFVSVLFTVFALYWH